MAKKNYKQRYYARNKAKYNKRNAERRALVRAYIRSVKEAFPCADCNISYPYYVMDFDHCHDKTYQIGAKTIGSIELLHEEMSKCEIVCSNCHRIRTHLKRNHSKISNSK